MKANIAFKPFAAIHKRIHSVRIEKESLHSHILRSF